MAMTKFNFLLLLIFVSILTTSSEVTGDEILDELDSGFKEENICIDGHSRLKNYFSWVDYVVLGGMLVISCGIGVFYGFFSGKQTTSDDFLLGGSSMGTFPMAMSLAASFITAIELLGNPAEMYKHGAQYWMMCLAFILVVPITSKLYLPVYMKLRLTSTFEYFQLRFSPSVRYLSSGLYILQMMLYTSVAVYAPALALSHVTGINVYLAVTVVYLVCIFYASQGGMKAVIMTDTFQAAVLVGSILLIVYFGEKIVGGAGVIWSENYNTQRLEIFDFRVDPTIQTSFWSVVIGGTFYWLTMFCSNQASIQKYMSVESISQVKTALWVSSFGLILIYTINFYTGMIMVAHYRICDPLRADDIKHSDEILPLYIISEMGHWKGVTGFFVAGIFAASLGTVASALNSLAAVTCQDFITGAFGFVMPESKGALWAKWISLGYGALSFALVFIIEQLGSVMQVAISFNGMVGGVTLGLFSLGMFFPWANTKGAIVGGVFSTILVTCMALGQQVAISKGDFVDIVKDTSIFDCPCYNYSNPQDTQLLENNNSEIFVLFRISFLWYSAIGCVLTIVIGLIASLCTGFQNPADVDEDLLSPPVKKLLDLLPENLHTFLKLKRYSVEVKKEVQLEGVVNITMDILDEKNIDKK